APALPAHSKDKGVLECGGKPAGRDAALALHATSRQKAPSPLRSAGALQRYCFESTVVASLGKSGESAF
ncbi:MAG: hypothetical protein NZ823_07590, partial [Blastocatellia bacterium]|nr:hypothetical protein [Blastocatellia bacterium]